MSLAPTSATEALKLFRIWLMIDRLYRAFGFQGTAVVQPEGQHAVSDHHVRLGDDRLVITPFPVGSLP
jgi:hypothetical protein